ncbi:MAG: AAA family ATPase [Actinomycetota bacterium]|nr:AAA family ATPase [Actinomycetota bacterium]
MSSKSYLTVPRENRAIWEIKDPEGRVVAEHVREDQGPDAKKVRWRLPGGSFSDGLKGRKLETLPLYGAHELAEWSEERPVAVVEGEKAADALNGSGIIFALGTVTGASATPGPEALEILRGREVILWTDADELGRKHMRRVAERLEGVAELVRWYDWPEAKEKDDAADHPAVIGGNKKALGSLLNDLLGASRWEPKKPEGPPKNGHRPRLVTAKELMAMDLPPVRWAVPDILPDGVSLLVGRPKMGKSWLAFGLAIAVASGGYALGKKPVERGEVLYLALEDNDRRLQRRLRKMLNGDRVPDGLTLATDWPRLDEGGVEDLDGWLKGHPECRLVILDTLKAIRSRRGGNRNAYDVDYESVEPLVKLAGEHNVAVLVVHHTRKLAAADPWDEINSSTGLTGGVDGALMLRGDRGEQDATLYVDGRDIEEQGELALKWDPERASWTLLGDAGRYRISEEQRRIIELLDGTDEPMGPKAIHEAAGLPYGSVRVLLPQMVREGLIDSHDRGKYTSINIVNNLNNGNGTNIANNSLGQGKGDIVNASPQEPLTTRGGESPISNGDSRIVNDVNGVNGVPHTQPSEEGGRDREDGDPVIALLENPSGWLATQLAKCRENERLIKPTCSTIAFEVYRTASRWAEVEPVLRRYLGEVGA